MNNESIYDGSLTPERIDYAREIVSRVYATLADIQAGQTAAEACRKNNLKYLTFRKIVNFSANSDMLKNLDPHIFSKVPTKISWSERAYGNVFGVEIGSDEFYEVFPDDAEETLDYILDEFGGISDREAKIFRMHMSGNLSYVEIGKELGLSKERIHQIEAKVFRKLHHPTRYKLLRVGLSALEISRKEYLNDIKRRIEQAAANTEFQDPKLRAIDLELSQYEEEQFGVKKDLTYILDQSIAVLNLPVRVHNCLTRAGFTTVDELCDVDEEDLIRVRDLGRIGFSSLVDKIHYFGFKMKWERENIDEPPFQSM